jgi:hypothetical protein
VVSVEPEVPPLAVKASGPARPVIILFSLSNANVGGDMKNTNKHTEGQCFGSMKFWYGSGSADPHL